MSNYLLMIGKHLISIVMRALILNMTGILICSMVTSALLRIR